MNHLKVEPIQVIEHKEEITKHLKEPKDKQDIEDFAKTSQYDKNDNYRPVLKLTNKGVFAQNFVGIIQTKQGTIIEILPKIHGLESDPEKTKDTFYKMLRTWRRFKNAAYQSDSSINSLKNFPMLEVFIKIFIDNLTALSRRGLARQYVAVEDNLPYLKGRLQFAEHIRHNLANQARFYVEYDEFNANRPSNRLIKSTIDRLLKITRQSKNKQSLMQLQVEFDEIPLSKNYQADLNRHRIDRSMTHYQPVMQWVELFLFNQGLATYKGKHLSQCLLFPMEQIFEDYVAHCFRKYQSDYSVKTQSPQRSLATFSPSCSDSSINLPKDKDVFTMKPDIALMESNSSKKPSSILDAKWKILDTSEKNNGISQADMYQLFAYGIQYDCNCLFLIYPKTKDFDKPIYYKFNKSDIVLCCYPFDCQDPRRNFRPYFSRQKTIAFII